MDNRGKNVHGAASVHQLRKSEPEMYMRIDTTPGALVRAVTRRGDDRHKRQGANRVNGILLVAKS